MNGLLGNVNITTTGNIKVYTVPADTYTVLSLISAIEAPQLKQ